MAFEILRQQFGDLTEYVIQQPSTGNRFVVVPELGGIVRQLSLRKGVTLFSLLKTPPTPQSLKDDTQSASELLFPFASRIPDGKYKFLGKEYQLAKNETGNKNAIHGLVRKNQFQLTEQSISSEGAAIKLSYHLDQPEGYPFNVQFSVLYSLSTEGTFSLTYEAMNAGAQPCPVMFGWHPYFELGNEDADAWKINIPSDTIVDFDDNQIPTGTSAYPFQGSTPLFRKVLDNCFVVKSNQQIATTELRSDNQDVTLHIEQETGEGKFNFLVVYTPPARDCVAIEALTGNVDSFNNSQGLNILGPGQAITGTIRVQLR
ncbi:aldose 1-epimerase [Dyadobacter helix]|nr:aldose 1-epimerase [Dyadobacter sp. CECT 9275]